MVLRATMAVAGMRERAVVAVLRGRASKRSTSMAGTLLREKVEATVTQGRTVAMVPRGNMAVTGQRGGYICLWVDGDELLNPVFFWSCCVILKFDREDDAPRLAIWKKTFGASNKEEDIWDGKVSKFLV